MEEKTDGDKICIGLTKTVCSRITLSVSGWGKKKRKKEIRSLDFWVNILELCQHTLHWTLVKVVFLEKKKIYIYIYTHTHTHTKTHTHIHY